MKLPSDFKELLEEFGRAGVEFVLIGGYAIAFHHQPRATKDLDLLLRGTPENLERASQALAAYGASKETVEAVRNLGPTEVGFMGKEPLRVDFLRSIEGVETDDVFARSVVADWAGVRLRVISLDDLILNKRTVARKRDLADVESLERVRAKLAERPKG